jgi:hypothetical protein
MPSDDDLSRIRTKDDWTAQQQADYKKLWWLSQRLIDLILRFPRFIRWMRRRHPVQPETRIARLRRLLRENRQNPGEHVGGRHR